MPDFIKIRGARQHNLKNIDVDIPRHQLVVITGVSGSGKSSLAFNTLYAEGQRRYVESLSAYARQFLDQLEKPDVDFIEGLSPAIAIEQRTSAPNPRSTIATATEVYDYLRILYAAAGQPHDPETGDPIHRTTRSDIVAALLALPEGTKLILLAPLHDGKTLDLRPVFDRLKRQGFVRVRVDGGIHELDTETKFDRKKPHTVEAVIDRLVVRDGIRARLVDSVETALRWSGEDLLVLTQSPDAADREDWDSRLFTTAFANPKTGYRLGELTPKHFSFNSHLGACPACHGLGVELEVDPTLLVPDGELSIANGAIKSWWARNKKLKALHDRQILALAQHYKIDLDIPYRDLPADFQHALVYGTGEVAIKTGWKTGANSRSVAKPFEGLAVQAHRLHEESDSEVTKRNVRRFMNPKPCPACEGKRLRPEILAVTLSVANASPVAGASCPPAPPSTSPPDVARASRPTNSETNAPTATARAGRPHHATSKPLPSAVVGASCPQGLPDRPHTPDSPDSYPIHAFTALPISEALALLPTLQLPPILADVANEIRKRLAFLDEVGLGYLTLDRESGTLSGGEAQRIRLATQIGAGLAGVLYVLDEPSIGLHQHDNERLIETLRNLRDLGNTVIVVEHDEETIRAADHVIDLGPAAGPRGGEIMAQGTPDEVAATPGSPTGQFLAGTAAIAIPKNRRAPDPTDLPLDATTPHSALPLPHSTFRALTVHNARGNNLRGLTAAFPLGCLTCVTGMSGSGKSTLVDDILRRALFRRLYQSKDLPGAHDAITGLDHIDKAIVIDQAPIGRSPRSNPATFTGVFTVIRDLFAKLPMAKVRGYKTGRFSFNIPGGRCEACQGDGLLRIDMHFLSDIYVTCDACSGRRYNQDTLDITYKGKNIAEVLALSIDEATRFFTRVPQIHEKLRALGEVGLGYLKLGQSATTLSGGEAQRIKLAAELGKRATGRTLYLLDEPTTGLHFSDIETLLKVLFRLRDAGNTLIVIEHNLDVIKSADWILDLGPGGGSHGGRLIAQGTPETVARSEESLTARYLRRLLP